MQSYSKDVYLGNLGLGLGLGFLKTKLQFVRLYLLNLTVDSG